ncbi:MAG TPA: GH3 auxin-responsive promoter family protein [Verrucomicrobiae bacterium]|nr:GH3 auxin-responsive promoter family protein [Verrucomicrobiae bacterium]
MNFTPAIANSLWFASNLPAAARFRRALNYPAETQAQLLRDYLARSAETEFGRKHGFAGIKNYKDFAARVPLHDYDDLEPWIDRIKRGENSVLTAENVTHLIPTSGSSGAKKLIPFTATLQHEFNHAVGAWTNNLYRRFPSIVFGSAYWSISPAIENSEKSIIPIGFEDDSAYLGGARKRLVDAVMAVPSEMRLVSDMEQFQYLTLLCLLRREDLRLISIWHPSFLSLLLDALPVHWENLLHDIETGNCRHAKGLSPKILSAMKFRPMPHRARQLKNLNWEKPETLWPHLKIISCWGDGHAKLARAEIQRRFPSVFVQPKGLLATECALTIPFFDFYPLAITSHFFEFSDEQGRIFLAHELEKGKMYEVIVTTGGGLWRYRLGDQVEVNELVGKTPSLRFLGRAGNVSDRCGEKLSEAFATQVIQKTIGGKSSIRFALLAPHEEGLDCRYILYIEGDIENGIAERLDNSLCENPHYAWCRKAGQLQPPSIFKIKNNGYESFVARELSRERRLGEIKPTFFSKENDWSKHFCGDFCNGETAHQRATSSVNPA